MKNYLNLEFFIKHSLSNIISIDFDLIRNFLSILIQMIIILFL